jgi:hypothetical protein
MVLDGAEECSENIEADRAPAVTRARLSRLSYMTGSHEAKSRTTGTIYKMKLASSFVALAVLVSSIVLAQNTQYPLHDNGLNKVVQWYVHIS